MMAKHGNCIFFRYICKEDDLGVSGDQIQKEIPMGWSLLGRVQVHQIWLDGWSLHLGYLSMIKYSVRNF